MTHLSFDLVLQAGVVALVKLPQAQPGQGTPLIASVAPTASSTRGLSASWSRCRARVSVCAASGGPCSSEKAALPLSGRGAVDSPPALERDSTLAGEGDRWGIAVVDQHGQPRVSARMALGPPPKDRPSTGCSASRTSTSVMPSVPRAAYSQSPAACTLWIGPGKGSVATGRSCPPLMSTVSIPVAATR